MPKIYVHITHRGDPSGWETIFGFGRVDETASRAIHVAIQVSLRDWLLGGDVELDVEEVTSTTGLGVKARHIRIACKNARLADEASAAVLDVRARQASDPPEST